MRGTVCPCLDAKVLLTSNSPYFVPTCHPLGHPGGTGIVTTSQEPLSHKGDLPLRRLKVAHR